MTDISTNRICDTIRTLQSAIEQAEANGYEDTASIKALNGIYRRFADEFLFPTANDSPTEEEFVQVAYRDAVREADRFCGVVQNLLSVNDKDTTYRVREVSE